MKPGCLVGVDFGTRRVGLAISDAERRIAVPLAVYERQTVARDAEHFRALAQKEAVAGWVVGLPVHMSGAEGKLAQDARRFGTWLSATTGLPVCYWDERLSSALADRLLADTGMKARQRRGRLDQVAAQIILQSYLEAGCPEPEPPPPLHDGA
ncbi:MAG TPA: Holliday junction resolvase RuvX [Gemmatales bacterium]|nr:Holliday junction resolvase RuvX [Gemmatales bacterium]HMP58950.1 Holliday junction resolvase RuvX [Gemmatales bacterium]